LQRRADLMIQGGHKPTPGSELDRFMNRPTRKVMEEKTAITGAVSGVGMSRNTVGSKESSRELSSIRAELEKIESNTRSVNSNE